MGASNRGGSVLSLNHPGCMSWVKSIAIEYYAGHESVFASFSSRIKQSKGIIFWSKLWAQRAFCLLWWNSYRSVVGCPIAVFTEIVCLNDVEVGRLRNNRVEKIKNTDCAIKTTLKAMRGTWCDRLLCPMAITMIDAAVAIPKLALSWMIALKMLVLWLICDSFKFLYANEFMLVNCKAEQNPNMNCCIESSTKDKCHALMVKLVKIKNNKLVFTNNNFR